MRFQKFISHRRNYYNLLLSITFFPKNILLYIRLHFISYVCFNIVHMLLKCNIKQLLQITVRHKNYHLISILFHFYFSMLSETHYHLKVTKNGCYKIIFIIIFLSNDFHVFNSIYLHYVNSIDSCNIIQTYAFLQCVLQCVNV